MNTNNIIKNLVLEKMDRSGIRDFVREVRQAENLRTLVTEYRILTTESGNQIYQITQTYKEHFDFFICWAGPSFRYSHRTSIWEQEEGRDGQAYRYSEILRERKHEDPEGPWSLEHLIHREETDLADMPTADYPIYNFNLGNPSWKEDEKTFSELWNEAVRIAKDQKERERKALLVQKARWAQEYEQQREEAEHTR